MNPAYCSTESRTAQMVDQLLDMLLVFTLLGAPLIFYTRGYDVFEFNKITVLRVLTSAAACLMLFKVLFVRPLTLIRSALDVPVLAWFCVCLVCTFHTVSWRLSVHGVYEDFEGITTWFMYVFLFWWPLQHVRTERQIRLVFGAVVLAGTVAGFYGLLQNFGIDFVPWNPSTYNPERMFSTMGNPNFLAAYTVMSMPITFIFFLELPSKIKTDQLFCAALVVLSLIATAMLCELFSVNLFDFNPASYGATGALGMLLSLKFVVTKLLLVFPIICAVLLFYGRLRLILLLSLVGQLLSTLFTKSRGGVFSMVAIILLFSAAFAFEVFGTQVLFSISGIALAVGIVAVGVLVLSTGIWQGALDFAFTQHPYLAFALFIALLAAIRWFVHRRGKEDLLARNLDYVLGMLLMVWFLFFIPAIRQTTFEMLERVSKLFHPSEVKYTPRLFIWKSALAMLRDNPIFGTGLDTFQISFPPYREALYWILEWNGTPEKAHNFIMQTAATMGFAGLITFAWMHVAWVSQSFRDWRRQPLESRRLLLLGGFGAWLGFFVQNIFSFTVVGYGSLWWILWGLLAAMQHTWEREAASAGGAAALEASGTGQAAAGPPAGSSGGWGGVQGAWVAGVLFLGLALLACAAAGPTFFNDPSTNTVGYGTAVLGLVALIWVVLVGWDAEQGPGLRAWLLVAAASVGAFMYSCYSVKIWVADTFYKQGQVGINANQPGYAALMYQKSAGQIVGPLTDDQQRSIFEVALPSEDKQLKVHASLNPDQELYWVKMGIAFENAAADETDPTKKMDYFRTALAVHQITLQMNPINGYNYNNKGRVLKAMGEAFGRQEYFQKALEHYNKAIALDENNVYFNLDKANTLLSLKRTPEAFDLIHQLTVKFPDFAVPYSYAGFIKMQTGENADAVNFFIKALKSDWKGDDGSKALAAINLGVLEGRAGRWADSETAYSVAVQANPESADSYLRLADAQAHEQHRAAAVATLQRMLQVSPNDPHALSMLKQLGASK